MIFVENIVYIIIYNYLFFVNWLVLSFGNIGVFFKVIKLYYICILNVRIKFNIIYRKLIVIVNYYKYNRIWFLNIINEF